MANEEVKSNDKDDLYAVLGLKKECSDTELRNAYKKLALKWHPDRCLASGNEKSVDEAKKKFQVIQQAYSVLSDANKRFMYDLGACDDDDEHGMGEFLKEMAGMMSQIEPNEGTEESLEDLKNLFEEMFQEDIMSFHSTSDSQNLTALTARSTSTSYACHVENSSNNKRHSSEIIHGETYSVENSLACCLVEESNQKFSKRKGVPGGGAGNSMRHGRRQKV